MKQYLHVFLKQDVLLCDNVIFQLKIFDSFILDSFQVIFLLLDGLHAVQLYTTFMYVVVRL